MKDHVSFLYLSPFLLQDSCKFPSNFLVQDRAEFPIEFTLSVVHMALTFSWITHMTNYLDFLQYFQAWEKSRKFQLSLTFSDTVVWAWCSICVRVIMLDR